MYMSSGILFYQRKIALTEKSLESIESSKFVSYKRRIPGKFDSRKGSQPKKDPPILAMLIFRELCE